MRFVETPVFTVAVNRCSTMRAIDSCSWRWEEFGMKDAAFKELLTSVKQAGRIRRGALDPSRATVFQPANVRAVRAKIGASQADFALMIGVSVATLRNWEQGRRTPEGPALALLRVAAKNPKAVVDALHGTSRRGAA